MHLTKDLSRSAVVRNICFSEEPLFREPERFLHAIRKMPATMKFYASPSRSTPRGSSDNKLQGTNFSKNMSADSMKGILGQDHLVWDSKSQQQQHPRLFEGGPTGGHESDFEYPLPGSTAACDMCGDVVNRYYHCAECREEQGGLFDLCIVCAGAAYLRQGAPALLEQARRMRHPTHDFQRHKMVHVFPPS